VTCLPLAQAVHEFVHNHGHDVESPAKNAAALAVHARCKPMSPDVDLLSVARRTPCFTVLTWPAC